MGKFTRNLILGTALLLSATSLSGCGSTDDPNTLEIYIVNAGYRYEWAHSIRDLFLEQDWVKEKYPDLKITIYQNDDQGYADTLLRAGQSSNRFDLLIALNLIGYAGTDDILDLTDCVYNTYIPGTTTKFIDVSFQSYLDSFAYVPKGGSAKNARYYFAPWAGGMNGIIYNASFFEDYDYEVPNTTDELIAIADDFHAKTYKGNDSDTDQFVFIQGKDESYFDQLFDIWWAQYQGIQGYFDYFNGVDDGSLSRNIFKQQGRLKSLEVMHELVGNNNHYVSPKTSYQNFMSNQRAFLKGDALFNVNGDWFVSEMKSIREDIIENRPDLNYSFKMMKTPVLSDVIELCDSIDSDAELSALIDAIDNESTALTGTGYEVTRDDFEKIKEARGVVSSLGTNHTIAIPSYALAKDPAVDFVRFMATEEAQDAYIRATNGASLPFKYNLTESNPDLFNEIDPLHQDRISYLNSTYLEPFTLPSRFNFPLLRYGGVDAFYLPSGYDFFSKMKDDNKLPQTYYDETIEHYTQQVFEEACRKAGLM